MFKHNLDMHSQMDPYVKLYIGDKLVHRTKTQKKAGTWPSFNESVDIDVRDLNEKVRFEAYD